MTRKKTYSRMFIILQEMKKNLGISSDKIPNGYVKLEIKNTRCRICFYVQNLKPIADDYKMLLLSGDKNDGKAIDLGKAKIDSNGKCEINIEKSMDSLVSNNISIDKIIGAAIAIVDSGKIDGIMCGFSIKDIPEDWTKYEVVEENNKQDKVKEVENVEANVKKEKELDNKEKEICDDRKHEKKEEESYSQDPIINPQNEIQDIEQQEDTDTGNINEQNGNKNKSGKGSSADDVINPQNDIQELKEEEQEEEKVQNEENINGINNKVKSNTIDFDGYEGNINASLKESFFRGASGEFFEYLVSGLEEVKDVMPEIKKSKWYKIRVNTLDDLYYITDYRKYSMIYYPMVNNYPYICKHGHYLFGYKLDENNNLKYMLYAVPGTKHPYDQPYGGKTGYVMWLPKEKGKEGEKDLGYWVMFYDFKDSTVCVPAKKQ